MRVKRSRPHSIGRKLAKGLTALVVVAGAAFCLAFVWQNVQEQAPLEVEGVSLPANQRSDIVDAVPQPEEEAAPTQPVSSAPQAEEPEGETPEALPSEQPGAVPASPKVDNAYFADAIFFGDSLSTGIPLYQVAGSPDTVAVKGISPLNIVTDQVVVSPSGESMTVLESAKQYGEKKKVYIMLGSNGLWMDIAGFTKGYREFISAVEEQYPGATVYLQSMPPATVLAKEIYPSADNDVIREFNVEIARLARETGSNFVDVYAALVDGEGNLPIEASPSDGMHLTPEYYQKWFDYLKVHTVEEKQQ